MAGLWFTLIAFMLTVYVLLDGFDLGAGMVHLFVARRDDERRVVLNAIGPVWDGNEVWLLASGGVLVYAFPRAYAAAFSGFYLPLMIALWLLILRGLSIELRSKEPSPLWRAFWDATFFLSSLILSIVLGAALGNVLRGVPLDASGFFRGPLFTNFRTGGQTGALDWYTVSVGAFTTVALAAHGACYLQRKAAGEVAVRARRLGRALWLAAAGAAVLVTIETWIVRPALIGAFARRPWVWPLPVVAVGGAALALVSLGRGRERAAFLGSSAFLVGMLGAAAATVYPTILRSTVRDDLSLTVDNAASGRAGLVLGLLWWVPAIALAIGYFAFLFRSFAGKVTVDSHLHY